MSRTKFEAKCVKTDKTSVKQPILDLGHALLTRHATPRMHKPHECHLEGSWGHLGASCGPYGSHLGVLWQLPGASWEPSGSHPGVLWELPGASWEPSGLSKTCVRKTIQQHPQPLTIQPRVIILQPGLAECAKLLKR